MLISLQFHWLLLLLTTATSCCDYFSFSFTSFEKRIFILELDSHLQCFTSHLLICTNGSTQDFPPLAGGGFEHLRLLFRTSLPQRRPRHSDHTDHADTPPSTVYRNKTVSDQSCSFASFLLLFCPIVLLLRRLVRFVLPFLFIFFVCLFVHLLFICLFVLFHGQHIYFCLWFSASFAYPCLYAIQITCRTFRETRNERRTKRNSLKRARHKILSRN